MKGDLQEYDSNFNLLLRQIPILIFGTEVISRKGFSRLMALAPKGGGADLFFFPAKFPENCMKMTKRGPAGMGGPKSV